MPGGVHLVEREHNRELAAVGNGHSLKHVGHEALRVAATAAVEHKRNSGCVASSKRLKNNLTAGRPGEGLDLPGGVYKHIVELPFTLGEDIHHLVKPSGEEVAGGENAAIGPQAVLGHHLRIIDGVARVNVGFIR